MITGKLDFHSKYHFGGSALISLTYYVGIKDNTTEASILSASMGLCWELFDELNHITQADIQLFDPRGGDWVDIAVNLSGILVAYLIIKLFN
jgi:hypothetical protein